MTPEPSIKVLIAEDDADQLRAMRQWIGQLRPAWSVVAEVRDAAALLPAIERSAPDLLILDIHLGDDPVTDWLPQLPADMPVIFTTGDPGYAVQAFERAAIDYLVKPVTLRRLRQALDRAAIDARLAPPTAAPAPTAAHHWITMSRGADLVMVSEEEIVYLQADLKYTRIVSTRGEGLVRLCLGQMLARLSPHDFVRIHRSVAVNRRHVQAVRRNEMGQLRVLMQGRPEQLRVSRNCQSMFRSL